MILRYEGDQVFIVRRENTLAVAVQEAHRFLGKLAHYQLDCEDELNALLSSRYAGDTGVDLSPMNLQIDAADFSH